MAQRYEIIINYQLSIINYFVSLQSNMVFQVIHIDETDSTNRWLKDNGKIGMLVVAEYQTAGKGCGTNSWESERGKNLTFSMLIHPENIPANEQFRITEITSVAMCETLKRYGCKEVKYQMAERHLCG